MDAGVNRFPGFAKQTQAQKWHGCHVPAQPGRQDAGYDSSLGFALQNPKPKSGMDAAFGQRKG
jgi:hypothetical protein